MQSRATTPTTGKSATLPRFSPSRVSPLHREHLLGYALMLPIILVVSLLIFVPLVLVFWDSLHNKTFSGTQYDFVGLKNYQSLLTSSDFWAVFLRSLVWTVASVLLQIVAGFIM